MTELERRVLPYAAHTAYLASLARAGHAGVERFGYELYRAQAIAREAARQAEGSR